MSIAIPTVRRREGFTIVELLIVIVVIGILAAITIVAYNGIQQRARDAQRLSDIASIQTALELYFADNGSYPLCAGNVSCVSTSPLPTYANAFNTLGLSGYINKISNDPTNIAGQYGYYYARGYKKTGAATYASGSTATEYMIGTRLESRSGPTFSAWDNTNLNYLVGSSN